MVIDGHCDTLWAAGQSGRDWIRRSSVGHADLVRLATAGVNVQFMALFSDPAHRGPGYALKALEMIHRFYDGIERAAETGVSPAGVVLCRGDIQKARNGFWGLLSIEGGEAIGRSIEALLAFFRLGVRAMGLVWNYRNDLADGVKDDSGGGLTPFGKEVVRTMQEIGMIVDVSHLSESGFWDVLRLARGPIVASHSNARALCDHPRNLTDQQLKAIAETGGVVGVTFCPLFLRKEGQAAIDDVVRHIEHIASVAGVCTVALGSDFDGFDGEVRGLEDVTRLPAVAERLRVRGFSESDVSKVMGENWARVLERTLPS